MALARLDARPFRGALEGAPSGKRRLREVSDTGEVEDAALSSLSSFLFLTSGLGMGSPLAGEDAGAGFLLGARTVKKLVNEACFFSGGRDGPAMVLSGGTVGFSSDD
jgi:hypothetical protein